MLAKNVEIANGVQLLRERDEEMSKMKGELEEMTTKLENVQADLEGLRSQHGDVAEYQASIAQLQALQENKTVELEKLQSSIQQLTENCLEITEEKGKLEEELRERDETLKEKEEEISRVNKLREGELEIAKQMKEENQLQQSAIGGEMKEQLSTVTAEKDRALTDLQTAREEINTMQATLSGLEDQVANACKSKDEEAEKVASLTESLTQLRTKIQALEEEKSNLLERIDELNKKQNELLSDGDNRIKEEVEKVQAEMEALKSQAVDVSQYKTAIADWQTWADTQTAEFTKLQENLQQYTEAYTKAVEENARLLAVSQEKDREIDALKAAEVTGESGGGAPLQRENERLNARLDIMRSKFSELEASSTELREQLAKAEASLAEISEKNEALTGRCCLSSCPLLPKIPPRITVFSLLPTEERELLRNVEVENSRLKSDCESLKLRLEGEESEKPSGEFADFENVRQSLESEIGRLREELTTNKQQQPAQDSSAAAAAEQKLAFERGLLRQMEADLAAKDEVGRRI